MRRHDLIQALIFETEHCLDDTCEGGYVVMCFKLQVNKDFSDNFVCTSYMLYFPSAVWLYRNCECCFPVRARYCGLVVDTLIFFCNDLFVRILEQTWLNNIPTSVGKPNPNSIVAKQKIQGAQLKY